MYVYHSQVDPHMENRSTIDELAATRHALGCMGPTGPAQATQINQPHLMDPVGTACTGDLIPDLTTHKLPSRTVPYQPPSFNLDRPTKCLTKEERLEVHHNYISAVSNLEHKKDLINRLKRSEPHNIPTYEAEMTHHMALHNDVLGGIHTILKQDDYFRTLEELSAIDGLHAYDDIQLFPKLVDTPAVIERITSKADLLEKQLNRRSSLVFTKELASEPTSGISSSLSISCHSASVFNSVISVSSSLEESSKVGRRNWEGRDIYSGITLSLDSSRLGWEVLSVDTLSKVTAISDSSNFELGAITVSDSKHMSEKISGCDSNSTCFSFLDLSLGFSSTIPN